MHKQFHDEKERFLHDMGQFAIFKDEDAIDEVWQKIISDINEYEKLNQYRWCDDSIPEPSFSFTQSERPDIIYQCDDFIMGIECFEFDASRKTRKGSTQKQKEREADREIDEEHSRSIMPKEGFLAVERAVDVELSATSYCKSLLSNYSAHANSIADYRKNLSEISNGKRAMLTFFIEDSTALGNYVVTNNGTEGLNPLRIPDFLVALAETQGLDYVIIKTTECYVPSIRIQALSIQQIKSLLSRCYSPDDRYLRYKYSKQAHFWGMR